jgi:hypothetical protein
MKEVRIGLIGTGYIGKAHAIAYAQAPTVFNLRGRLVREMVAEVTPELAAARAQAFGFNRSTGTGGRWWPTRPLTWWIFVHPTICIKRWRWRRSATASTSTRRSRWR